MLLALTAALAADEVCSDWEPPRLVPVEDIGFGLTAESSGLVFVGDELRTLGDAGGESLLYAFGIDGTARGEQRIEGATNTDWEDLGAGPCSTESDETCIFIADIGDNDESRGSITLWRIAVSDSPTETATACSLAFPEGKRHDAEALLVFPDGTIRIVTKENDGEAKIFRIAAIECGGETQTLEEEAEIVLDAPVTGGAVGGNGDLVALRSLNAVWVWRGCTLDWTNIPEPIALTGEEQGEGVCFGPDDALYTTSEGDPLELHALACSETAALECTDCGCANTAEGLPASATISLTAVLAWRSRRHRTGWRTH